MLEIGTKVAIDRLVKECKDEGCSCKRRHCIDVVERLEDRDNGTYAIVSLKKAEKKYSSKNLTYADRSVSDKELIDLAKRKVG